MGISPGQLQSILSSRNIIFPGGELFTDDEQIILEPSGNFESIQELHRTVIKLPGKSEQIYLGDIVNVERGYVDPTESLVNYVSKPSLILAISMREGGNIINLGEAVKKQVERFKSVYPIGVEFDFLYFQTKYVDKKIKDFTRNLIQAVIIVTVVMLLFLGFRTGLVIVSLIPMAMVMALMIMGFLNIGLDQMSLAALIIALGIGIGEVMDMEKRR